MSVPDEDQAAAVHDRWLSLGLQASLLTVVGATIALWLFGTWQALTVSGTLDYGEGPVLYAATHWDLLYHPIERAPYLVSNYPPVYPILVGALTTVFGDPFVVGRVVSRLSALAVGLLVVGIVRTTAPDDRFGGPLAGLLVMTGPVVAGWSRFARVDTLGLLFAVGAIYWFVSRSGRSQLVGCACLCLLALYTKQSLISAPLAIAVALTVRGERRRAGWFVVGLGGTGLAGFAVLTLLTNGEAWRHLVVYNANAYSLGRLASLSRDYLLAFYPIVLAMAATAVLVARRRLPTVAIAFFAASALPVAFVGKYGSGPNYFLTTVTAAGIVIGIWLAGSDWATRSNLSVLDTRATLLVVLLVVQFGLFVVVPFGPPTGAGVATEAVDSAEGPILSEDPGLLVTTGRPLEYQPFVMTQLANSGQWDQRAVVDDIENGEFALIVLHSDVNTDSVFDNRRWTRAQVQAIRDHYRLRRHAGGYWLYEPAPSTT